jgi:aminomethyltransferase
MGLKTPLFAEHQSLGARIVPFGGWDMPLHYGSQLEEHHSVRRDAGMFDVSHMQVVDLEGSGALDFLRRLLANDVAKLGLAGKALYGCMLNERGGVVDDLIVYFRAPGRYRMVVNAATAEKDLAWMREQASDFAIEIRPRRDLAWMREQASDFAIEIRPRRDLAMIAVQGPNARAKAFGLIPAALQERAMALESFFAAEQEDWLVARTGYTGEDGLEIICPANEAPVLWRGLNEASVAPCGLGSRDTLRLEAGMNLYGQDMDEDVSPLESGLGWTIAWKPADRDFVGRNALQAQRERGGLRSFVGLLLTGRGVLRGHQTVLSGDKAAGEITSGGFAPTLQRSIAFARVAPGIGDRCEVLIRGKAVPARVVKPQFVRNGKPRIDLG